MSGLEATTVTTVGTVMVLYLGVLLVIGWRAARRTHGGEDFHLAGRSLGPWAAGVSSTASSESGWVTLGAVGMTYAYGVSGLWFAPGCLLGYLVNIYIVAPRLRPLSAEHGSVTLTDVITRRWGDPGNVLRMTATTIINSVRVKPDWSRPRMSIRRSMVRGVLRYCSDTMSLSMLSPPACLSAP